MDKRFASVKRKRPCAPSLHEQRRVARSAHFPRVARGKRDLHTGGKYNSKTSALRALMPPPPAPTPPPLNTNARPSPTRTGCCTAAPRKLVPEGIRSRRIEEFFREGPAQVCFPIVFGESSLKGFCFPFAAFSWFAFQLKVNTMHFFVVWFHWRFGCVWFIFFGCSQSLAVCPAIWATQVCLGGSTGQWT